jgi:hypothetical protein
VITHVCFKKSVPTNDGERRQLAADLRTTDER